MSNSSEKYLKYKSKYLEIKNKISIMKGGLIGHIPTNKLTAMKTNEEVPDAIKRYVRMITIPDTEVIRVGSSMLKIQPFYSDVDIMNIVSRETNSEELVIFFIQNLKKMIQNIIKSENTFFSDFKAGGLHWTVEEIMNEQNGQLKLFDACFIKDVIKLDIIGPYDNRYLEMSTFFILKSINEYINVTNDYFDNFKKSLLVDIEHYKGTKPFKAVKRVWSLSTISKDDKTLDMLQELIKSNIALIAQVNADVETIILLLEHGSKFDLKFLLGELDGFKDRLSNILDVSIDFEKINLMLDNIKLLFMFRNLSEDLNDNVMNSLIKLHDYLLSIINKETLEYLNSINFKFPSADPSIKKIKGNEILDAI